MKVISKNNSVGKISKIFPAFVFVFLFFCSIKSEAAGLPDFAFPATEEAKNDSILKQSLKSGNQELALRSVMNICVARNLKDESNSLKPNLALLDSVANLLNAPYKNLAWLLSADILTNEYNLSQNLYNSRKLPLSETFPDDPTEWSGDMYKIKIQQSLDSANNNILSLAPSSISGISSLITNPSLAEKTGLTIPQFIAFKSIALLKNFCNPNSAETIPFYKNSDNEIDTDSDDFTYLFEKKAEYLIQKIISDLCMNNSVVKALAYKENLYFLPEYQREEELNKYLNLLKDTEGEGLLLYEYWNQNREPGIQCYREISKWLENFPKGYGKEELEFALSMMSIQKIEAEFPKAGLPLTPIKGKVSVSNINKGFLLVYKLKNGEFTKYDELIIKKFKPTGNPAFIIDINQTGEIPFSYEKEVEISGLPEGLYAVIPSKTETLPSNWNKSAFNNNYSTIRISDITIITTNTTNQKDAGRVYVVKASDQQPVENAVVEYFKGDSNQPLGKLITNCEGFVNIPNGFYHLEASLRNSKAIGEAGFNYYSEERVSTPRANILTDLSVYRPGDTISYAVVGWLEEKFQNSLLKNIKAEISLRDANYITIASDTIILDKDGRASGELTIAKGRLLGNYTISATFPDLMTGIAGSTSVLVEEYKTPPFLISLQQENSESKDSLYFRGGVHTYSGMPLTGALVKTTIEYFPRIWRFHGVNATYHENLITNQSGEFELSLPISNLKGTIFETGKYCLKAEVTTQAGETEISQPLYFYLGKQLEIRPSVNDKLKVEGDTIIFDIPTYNQAGFPVKDNIEYQITNLNDSSIILRGKFESPQLKLPSIMMPSGKYKLEFITRNAEQVSTETVIWRDNDIQVPYPTPLWVPVTQYYYDEDQKTIEVKFGSYWKDYILYILSDGEKVIESKWIHTASSESPHPSLINIPVEIPRPDANLFITLCGLHNFETESAMVKVTPKSSLKKLNVHTISYRDNLLSGEEETWTFKFKIEDKAATYVNAFAVMTDKALNAIRDFKWNLYFTKPYVSSNVRLMPFYIGQGFSYTTFNKSAINNFTPVLSALSWETYGYPLTSFRRNRERGPVLYKAMATKNAMADFASDEMVESVMEESADTVAGSQVSESKEELRPIEMPLAFFMPNLKSDEEGNLIVKFKVPDFPTTRQFQLAGYTDELLSTSLVLDATVTKPVMVKSSLPRYLRTGDKAEFSAILFNNTSSKSPVEGCIEIYNGATGEMLLSKLFAAQNLEPSTSRIINIEFTVPEDISSIVVRSYAIGEFHKDGEEGYIQIFPSSTPVTEAITFYASSEQELINIPVPALKKDSNITLKYCDNPLWEVLLSLPAYKQENNSSALSVVKWLFATLTSSNIINKNPDIKSALRAILEKEDSSLLISNLQKDSHLKITPLETSPWINNANAETIRLRSLQQYFDSTSLLTSIYSRIDALKNLQNQDGGFSWLPEMKSSPFITYEVLKNLSYLHKNGSLSPIPEDMVKKAMKYYERYLVELTGKNKVFPTTLLVNYLYIRKMWNGALSKDMKNLEKTTVDSIISQWRHWNITEKARGAMVLTKYTKQHPTAILIGASLKEFINNNLSTEEQICLLELFQELADESSTVDNLKQSILLKKETEDWTTNSETTGWINFLTKDISTNEIHRRPPEFYIGDRQLTNDDTFNITGNYTINLDPKEVSGKEIYIRREKGLPAWGGVVSQYISPIKEVKASKIAGISIEKHIYVENKEGKIKETGSIRKGDKIKVVLNISSDKDMDYVILKDSRSACLQPSAKTSGLVFIDGISAYQEIRTDCTTFFIEHLAKGKYVISYDCYCERDGEYSLGIAELQSLYSPIESVHSSGRMISSDMDK